MPKIDRIKPFNATFYNPDKFKKFENLICPPYDVITSQAAAKYRKSSPYNYCNVLLKDNSSYSKLQKKFSSWIKNGILVEDEDPHIYFICQAFKVKGRVYNRYGFVALLKMNEKAVAYPHEKTHTAPKKDRMAMIENLKANLSPIFLIYPEKRRDTVKVIADRYTAKAPFLKVKDKGGVQYKVWRISEKEEINSIAGALSESKLLIADGHHRFEAARKFYSQNKNKEDKYRDINYILAYFTCQDENLLVLPTHRVIKKKINADNFMRILKSYFYIDASPEKVSFLRAVNKYNQPFTFGFYQEKRFISLCLKNEGILDKINPEYRNLDVYLLHEWLFKEVLKFDTGSIEYSKDIDESIELADKYNGCSFILRKPDISAIMNLALKGYKLPQKTTYFHPKFVSGLLLRRL